MQVHSNKCIPGIIEFVACGFSPSLWVKFATKHCLGNFFFNRCKITSDLVQFTIDLNLCDFAWSSFLNTHTHRYIVIDKS